MFLSHLLVRLPPVPLRSQIALFSMPCLIWNKLPAALREPVSPLYAYLSPSFSFPLSPSITSSL